MSALAMLCVWLAANYAVAAALAYRGARRLGADRPAARRAALSWPADLAVAVLWRRVDARPALRAGNA
jgi:hypothetical protein